MNTITYRIKDFLKENHPFSFLTSDEQFLIAKNISVRYFEANEFIFDIGKPIFNHFFLVREGAVGLYAQNNQLTEQCDEGDLFGLRAIIRKDNYKLTAKALEECILYTIPFEMYDEILSKNTEVTQFIISNFTSNLIAYEKHSDSLKIGTRIHQVSHANGIQDNEHHHVFIAELKVPIERLSIQKEEVDDVQLFDLVVLKNTKNIENVLLPKFHEYYCMVYDQIIKKL